MLRKIIRKLNNPSRLTTTISLVSSVIGLSGVFLWFTNEIRNENINLQSMVNDIKLQMVAIGVTIACFIIIKNILADIENVFFEEERIVTGIGFPDNRYFYKNLFDTRCKEAIFVGQNMRTLMSKGDFRNHIVNLLHNNKDTVVTMIISTPEIQKVISKSIMHYQYPELLDSLTEMRDLYHYQLGENERPRFLVHAHPGATSLSAMIRDPNDNDRGVLIFTPKWATDRESENRIYCVIEKWEHRVLFNKLYGHVPGMTRRDSGSLKEICEKVGVEWLDK